MEFKDYYKTLDVGRDATTDEIKRAYRRLARKYHPDVSSEADAEARFKEVQEAYAVLKDEEKRAAYDRLGADWKAGQDFRPPPGWEGRFEFRDLGQEFGGPGAGFGDAGGGIGGFSDFFESLFGGAARARGGVRPGHVRARGRDDRLRVRITLDEAYRGVEKTLHVQRPGARGGARAQTLKVKIPAGVVQGQQVRLPRQGQQGLGGGESGDLFLEIDLAPHRLFRVEGKDVYLTLPIAPWEAALGATVEVPTLGGQVDLRIPAGSQSGGKLRLKGRGLGGKRPGDQYVVLQIVTPAADTDAARAIYDRMAREFDFNPRQRIGSRGGSRGGS